MIKWNLKQQVYCRKEGIKIIKIIYFKEASKVTGNENTNASEENFRLMTQALSISWKTVK